MTPSSILVRFILKCDTTLELSAQAHLISALKKIVLIGVTIQPLLSAIGLRNVYLVVDFCSQLVSQT